MRGRTPLRAGLNTAGERLAIECAPPRVAALVRECADGTLHTDDPSGPHTVEVSIEASARPFDVEGWVRLTRDSWHRDGRVVVRDVCTAGLDLLLEIESDVPRFTFRRRPPVRTRAAAALLPARARLLTRAAIMQFPALWWSAHRGRAPIHAPALSAGGSTLLLVGPSGVGKTTLILRETALGGLATGDNVSVSDGVRVWGLVEPVRAEGESGRAMPHGRRETHLGHRVERLEPDRLVVLRRGVRRRARAITPAEAARELVASTYVAGELRRFWPLAATLALGTGIGPPHPPVAEVAQAFAARLPCVEVELPSLEGIQTTDLLEAPEVAAWT
jgi:hypothetical protein